MLTHDELDRISVVLVAARNPLNIGAAARAMSNFGFLCLRVVNRYDVAFREARSAVGAPELLQNAEECASLADAIGECSLVVGTTAVGSRQVEHPVHRLEAGGQLIREHVAGGRRVALLFGSEKRGLSNDDLSYCHWLMRIPTREEHISMNLGQAVAVCLYELVRGESLPVVVHAAMQATAAELERTERSLLHALQVSGYIKPGTEAATEEKARRLIRRMHLSSEDAETWTGMLAKMQLKPRKPDRS
ncbi:MAG TPA: TrmH family RNA methyltransferase [Silvibacterium sp.]|nr:TrmH family RNA methyltransferase [Silvibacterium sp.]